jgi:hypothetical protein
MLRLYIKNTKNNINLIFYRAKHTQMQFQPQVKEDSPGADKVVKVKI